MREHYYLQRISRPVDIALFLQMAGRSCGYILPHRYLEKAELYALKLGRVIVGGFVFSDKERLLTHKSEHDTEITHIWFKDKEPDDEKISWLRRGIATVLRNHGVCRCEMIFRETVHEGLCELYHYGSDGPPRPLPKTRSWNGFTTRFVNGNSSKIPFHTTLTVKRQTTMDDVYRTLFIGMPLTVSLGLGLSVAPEEAIGSLVRFFMGAPEKIIADLSHISAPTVLFLLSIVAFPAILAALIVYKRLSGVLENVVPLVQAQQAGTEKLIEEDGLVPALKRCGDSGERPQLRIISR